MNPIISKSTEALERLAQMTQTIYVVIPDLKVLPSNDVGPYIGDQRFAKHVLVLRNADLLYMAFTLYNPTEFRRMKTHSIIWNIISKSKPSLKARHLAVSNMEGFF